MKTDVRALAYTSQTTDILSDITGDAIPPGKIAYFEARLRNALYHFILRKFLEKEASGELTKAKLARRIGYDPGRLSRTLGAPGNWTLNTVSNLLLGIAAEELKPTSESLLNRASRDTRTPWTIGNIGKQLAQMEKKGWITPQEAFEQRAWRARISKPRKKAAPIAKSANHP